jgi:catechol 2,3-dioxygenase-like lactoylglutathione lyase family enzyme
VTVTGATAHEKRHAAATTNRPTEVTMSRTETTRETPEVGTIDMKLEVVTLPVSDVDRAKSFYQRLGWRLDVDLAGGDSFRAVQMTPPHSQCSIHFGKGLTTTEPGSADRLILAVDDIDAAREELVGRGVEVGEVYEQRPPGFESLEGRSYFAYASFRDPDGNGWLLQEVTTRLPGREWED